MINRSLFGVCSLLAVVLTLCVIGVATPRGDSIADARPVTPDLFAASEDGSPPGPVEPTFSSASALPKPQYRTYAPSVARVAVLGQVSPTPIAAPVISSVSPYWVNTGATFQIVGWGFGSSLSGAYVKLDCWGRVEAAELVSLSDTQITARVPNSSFGTHGTTAGVSVTVIVGGRESNAKSIGVQNKPHAPPDIDTAIQPNNSSEGDAIDITGIGFSLDPTKNVINFGGPGGASAVTTAARDYGDNVHTVVTVTIPAGASSGLVTANRLDGLASEWGQGQRFSVVSPTVVTLVGTEDSRGILAPFYNIDVGSVPRPKWGEQWNHEYSLVGANFSKLRSPTWQHYPEWVQVRFVTSNGTWEGQAYIQSDTRLSVPITSGEWYALKPVLDKLPVGAPVKVRISGAELLNNGIRYSNEVTIPFAGQPVQGAVWVVEQDMASGPATVQVPRGDWLCLEDSGAVTPRFQLRAAPLWSGQRAFLGRCFLMNTVQTFQLTNDTNGRSRTITVKYGGVRSNMDPNNYVSTQQWATRYRAVEDGVTFEFGGGKLIIPPGALPAHAIVPGADTTGYYAISGEHLPSTAVLFDPEQTDGGDRFRISFLYGNFGYEPTQLLLPIQLVLPYEDSGRGAPPKASILDTTSGIYLLLNSTVDPVNKTVTLTIPAGTYSTSGILSTLGTNDAGGPVGSFPTNQSLNTSLQNVSATSPKSTPCGTLVDPNGYFRVEYTCDPASSSYATTAYAQEVLDAALTTRSTLGSPWRQLGTGYSITIRNLGAWSPTSPSVAGATTKGVFGQPWTYINRNVPSGAHLRTTVAHEVGHAYQRRYTTNILTKWIDEAVAGWVAWKVFGGQSDLSSTITTGDKFVEKQLPTSFGSGYTQDEAYAACAFIIWMEWRYPGSARLIYENYSDDTYATLNTATGANISYLIRQFAVDFWTQDYDPIRSLALLAWRNGKYTSLAGFSTNQTLPPLSTWAWIVQPTDVLRPSVANRDAVVRSSWLSATEEIHVWGTAAASGAPVGSTTLLMTLDSSHLSGAVGKVGAYTTHRVAMVNRGSGAQAFPFVFTIPDIATVSPTTGAKTGGYLVTISGSGFGSTKGSVTAGGASVTGAAITFWSDTTVQFTMPDLSPTTGTVGVTVRTLESDGSGADTNTATFTLN